MWSMMWTGDMADTMDEIVMQALTRVQTWWMTCAAGTGGSMWFPSDHFLYGGGLCQNRPDAMKTGHASWGMAGKLLSIGS